jgi:hypothetical protein
MMKRMVVFMLISFPIPVLALLWVGTCSCGRLHSEHSEATRLIEYNWNTVLRYDVLPIGEVQLVKANWIFSKGQTSPDDMHAYEVLRKQKAIVISSNIDLTSGNNFSWNNFFSLTQAGVIRKLTVAVASPRENELRCPDALRKRFGTENIICIVTGSGSVQEIVRSQKFQIGTKKYWLIMGNYRWKWSDTERKIRDAQGKVSDENMKFMAIAQYEDFTKEWQLAMIDYAPKAGQFSKQQEFDNVLQQAKIDAAPRNE